MLILWPMLKGTKVLSPIELGFHHVLCIPSPLLHLSELVQLFLLSHEVRDKGVLQSRVWAP